MEGSTCLAYSMHTKGSYNYSFDNNLEAHWLHSEHQGGNSIIASSQYFINPKDTNIVSGLSQYYDHLNSPIISGQECDQRGSITTCVKGENSILNEQPHLQSYGKNVSDKEVADRI